MRLQMRGVDHDPLRLAALAGQFGENLVEHAQAAPAHEPIVDCLVRAIVGRSIAPAQPVLDHKHDRADDPPVLKPERSRATAENTPRSDASEPETTKTNLPWRSILASPRNQPIRRSARTLMGPEPRRPCHTKVDNIQPLECGELAVGRRNERLNVVRAAMAEHLVE